MTTSPTIKALANRIWDNLTGTFDDRANVFNALPAAMREVRDERRPVTRIRASKREAATVVAKLIGRSLSQLESARVPLAGVSVHILTIIRAAQEPTHPFHAASAAFLKEHRLKLETTHTGRNPKVRIVRDTDPSPEEVLETLKTTTAGVLERQELRHAATAGRSSILDAVTAENPAVYRQTMAATMAATMTGHSGGKVSIIPVERGDD